MSQFPEIDNMIDSINRSNVSNNLKNVMKRNIRLYIESKIELIQQSILSQQVKQPIIDELQQKLKLI